MKKILLAFCLLLSIVSDATQWILSPSGSDANSGTIVSPFFSLNKAWTTVSAGDTIYMRAGNYDYTVQQYLQGKNGTAGNMIKIWNYPGEQPVIRKGTGYTKDAGGRARSERGGTIFFGDYVHWKGIEITLFSQEDGFIWNALMVCNSSNNIFERLNIHHNGAGMYIQADDVSFGGGRSDNNLILNSDFHHNYDEITGGGNADGLDIAYLFDRGTGNAVRGCRAWYNTDDGFDFFNNDGTILVDSCWAWLNGYIPDTYTPIGNGEGFKYGLTSNLPTTVLRITKNSLAAYNLDKGFATNGATCISEFYNNAAHRNGVDGFFFDNPLNTNVYRNNYAYNNYRLQAILSTNGLSVESNNSASDGSYSCCGYAFYGYPDYLWTNDITNADFVSLDSTQLDDARQSNGTLPVMTFLHLVTGSSLKDAGTNVGIGYEGAAPDKGPFEFTSGGGNISPTVEAGPNQTITLPTSSVTMAGSASDADGTISTKTWTKISGGAATITDNTSYTTTITGLVAGTYIFRLTVVDNSSGTTFDDVTITVNPAVLPPTNNILRIPARNN